MPAGGWETSGSSSARHTSVMSTMPARPGVADDRQVPEMAARHDLGRVTDACRGADDGRASGHQVMDPGTVHILSIGDRVGNVRFGDDACRLAGPGVQDHQSGRARVLHQIGGRSDVVALFYRRQRWPHYVCGCGRGGGVGLLGHLFYLYLSTFTFRWGPELGAGRGQECSPCPGFRLHVIRRPRRPSGQGWPDLGLGRQYRSGSPRCRAAARQGRVRCTSAPGRGCQETPVHHDQTVHHLF